MDQALLSLVENGAVEKTVKMLVDQAGELNLCQQVSLKAIQPYPSDLFPSSMQDVCKRFVFTFLVRGSQSAGCRELYMRILWKQVRGCESRSV